MSDMVLCHIDKAFGERVVLRDFSARLPAGSATALMGPSGAGKTTLARLLMGLERPDGGRIEGAVGQRFSCVFQEDRLCEQLSAADNVALVLPKQRAREAAPALRELGLADGEIKKAAGNLSGGERRRVALARALLAESDVVVLDEAFKGLDDEQRRRAFDFVRGRLGGRTLLVVTHDVREAEAFGARRLQLCDVAPRAEDEHIEL